MHDNFSSMPTGETPSQRAARQLDALMRRHHIRNAAEFEKMMADRHYEPLISQVTIRRILAATARTSPEQMTLRRLAEFVGEAYAQAFPEPEDEGAVVIEVDGRKIAFKATDGGPISPSQAARIRQAVESLSVGRARDIHEAKKKLRKKPDAD
jgi:hypothetical protein